MIVGTRLSKWIIDLTILILSILLIIGLFEWHHSSSVQHASRFRAARPGAVFALSGVDWTSTKRTLVLALSEGCRFCQASLPFYHQLSDYERHHPTDFQIVALLPQPENEAQLYLRRSGIAAQRVLQLDLATVGVTNTPTMALIDSHGVINNLWVGHLSPPEERDVWSRLKADTPSVAESQSTEEYLDQQQYEHLMTSSESIVLLDIRDRNAYRASHQPKAVNIPWDEVAMRAPDEISKASTIVISCQQVEPLYCEGTLEKLKGADFPKVYIMGDGVSVD